MLIKEALAEVDIDKLDAEILIGNVLGQDRVWVIAHSEESLAQAQKSMFDIFCARRRKGEPLAYIIGEKEFYGRLFCVNPSVLIPRPSTEGLIDCVKEFLRNPKSQVCDVDKGVSCIVEYLNKYSNIKTIVDIGTGSGCIAITLALELPHMKIIATDVSEEALEVAKKNAQLHGVNKRIDFRLGKNLQPVKELQEPFLIISNPPYIPDGEKLQLEVQCEPKEALFAGQDGMDVIQELIKEAHNHPLCSGAIVECRKEQASSLLQKHIPMVSS